MYRIGQSRDIHKLVEGRKLMIGLQEIPFTKGELAHSDGDVLVHAITEAIIGALGLGDLGKHFSDKDDKYKDISSEYFLKEVKKMLEKEQYEICNIDSTVLIEEPMIGKYIDAMKKSISKVLNISPTQINIKATRGEELGYIGRKEGIEAMAIVLIKKISKIIKL